MVALQNCCEMRGWEVLARQLLSSSVWSLLYIPQWFTNFWKCFCPQDWYCSRAGVSSRVLLLLRVKGWHILWLPHLLLENTAVFRMQDVGWRFCSTLAGISVSRVCQRISCSIKITLRLPEWGLWKVAFCPWFFSLFLTGDFPEAVTHSLENASNFRKVDVHWTFLSTSEVA